MEENMMLSTENIVKIFHERLKEEAQKKRQKQTRIRKIAALAAAVCITFAGVSVARMVLISKHLEGEENIVNGNTSLYASDFSLKVYAATEAENVELAEGTKILLEDTANANFYTYGDEKLEMRIIMPLFCEGEDIETVSYWFEGGDAMFFQRSNFSNEATEKVKEMHESQYNTEIFKKNSEWLRIYCQENNLEMDSYEYDEKHGVRGYQQMGKSCEIKYIEQKKSEDNICFRVNGTYAEEYNEKFTNDTAWIRTVANEILANYTLYMKATKADGSSSVRRFKFAAEGESEDESFELDNISIYSVE